MPNTINVRLRAPEQEVIKKMKEMGLEPNELIRGFLRDYAHEHFKEEKGYSEAMRIRAKLALEQHQTKKDVEEMSDQEYAEKVLKARVIGNMAYITTFSTSPYPIALQEVKNWASDDSIIKTHLSIMNGLPAENRWGETMDPEQVEIAKRNLENL